MRISIRPFRKWPRLPGVYDYRPCPTCAAMVAGNDGQRLHQQFHDDLDAADDEWEDPGGYVIPREDGSLPAEVRGGED